MHGLEHPLSGDRYELEADGTITVERAGATGRFDGQGRWLAGAITSADPLLCVWLAGGIARAPRRTPAPTPDHTPEADR